MRVANLSDVHLLEDGWQKKSALAQARARFLSVGRAVDEGDRKQRLANALQQAVRTGFDHLLLTGDLTEEGTAEQFAAFAQILSNANIPLSRVTIVPGNHDLYDLPGNLKASALAPALRSDALDFSGATVLPVDTTRAQHYVFSSGEIQNWDRAEATVRIVRPVVLVMHHPPKQHKTAFMQFMDGLRKAERMQALLAEHPELYIIHGHTHHKTSQVWRGSDKPRVFGTESVVTGDNPLRIYDIDSRGVTMVI